MEMFENDSVWRDGAKKVVAFYIDDGEKLGKATLDLHQSYTSLVLSGQRSDHDSRT